MELLCSAKEKPVASDDDINSVIKGIETALSSSNLDYRVENNKFYIKDQNYSKIEEFMRNTVKDQCMLFSSSDEHYENAIKIRDSYVVNSVFKWKRPRDYYSSNDGNSIYRYDDKNLCSYKKVFARLDYDCDYDCDCDCDYDENEDGCTNLMIKIKCPICNNYEYAMIEKSYAVEKLNDEMRNSIAYAKHLIQITSDANVICQKCNTIYGAEDISLPSKNDNYGEHLLSSNIFIDDNKIKISSLIGTNYCLDNIYLFKKIRYKITFNLETGRSYQICPCDIYTKKKHNIKTEGFKALNSITPTSQKIQINLNDFLKIGQEIQFYNQSLYGDKVIKFKDYALDLILDFFEINIKNDFISNEYMNKLTSTFASDEMIHLLIAYNKNPFIKYKVIKTIDCFASSYGKQAYINGVDFLNTMESPNAMDSDAEYNIEKLKTLLKTCKNMAKINKKNKMEILKEVKKYFNLNKSQYKYVINTIDNFSIGENPTHVLENLNKAFTNISLIDKSIKKEDNKRKLLKTKLANTNADFFLTNLYSLLKTKHNENVIVNNLIKSETGNIKDAIYFYDAIIARIPNYTLEVKKCDFNAIHDAVSRDHSKLTRTFYEYRYDNKILNNYNKEINGYKFIVAKDSAELSAIGNRMHICVGGYSSRVAQGTCMIIYVLDPSDNYIGCLEIDLKGILKQAKQKYNHRFKDEELNILLQYLDTTNTSYDTCYDLEDDVKDKCNNLNTFFKKNTLDFVVYRSSIRDLNPDLELHNEYIIKNGQMNSIHDEEVACCDDDIIIF